MGSPAPSGTMIAVSSTPAPGQQETINGLLGAAGRRTEEVPLRRDLVQLGPQQSPYPGPLQDIVRRHDARALDLYLLFRAMASAQPWDVTRDARIWGRALGLGEETDRGASAVSKTWARLDETYHLVRRERRGRLAKVTALHEAGDGNDYTYPNEGYFKLPFAYWTADQRWYLTLSLPAKASLLVALSLRPPFVLPAERGPAWYGISADTFARGFAELRRTELLSRQFTKVADWLSPTGTRTEYKFSLRPPFARSRRPSRSHLRIVSA
jgi:hypothetical protein